MIATLTTPQKLLAAIAAAALAASAIAFLPSPRTLLATFDRPAVLTIKAPPPVKLAPPPPLEAYDVIAARPLFNLDRKPDPAPPAKTPASPTGVGDLTQYRLTGIVRASNVNLALVQKTGGAALTLKSGDTLEGWTVQQVGEKGVTLTGGDRTELLAIPKAENHAQTP